MAKVQFVVHQDQQILLLDFSGVREASELKSLADRAIELVGTTTLPKSILGLIDLTGTPVRKGTRLSLQRMSRGNGRFMKAVTFVGLNPLWSFIMKTVLRATRRTNHRVFRTRENAVRWLLAFDDSPEKGMGRE